ncbi:hypothetical protein K3N28_17795 [Glycomyces sp. TRM65418]|uniref:hypothetical protein n=1 Tax=Glycomyces sp. TRM65418 TaxID=2867006 RepID=UPI001CE6BDF5|nr:hypothetical protein [Glycomyces sp. TRM65418]MCC3764914.1 hypothetical protein [Glycomyces sp. TRM65418]QZD54555.1 hypothetical protein K3N28_17705 [Glycomyces sp. TRM65418]
MRERRVGRSALPARLVAGAAGIAALVTAAPPVYAQDEESGVGNVLCNLNDPRLADPSGITAANDGDGWWIASGAENQDDTLSIMRVGEDCNVREDDEAWIGHLPIDPQALALDVNGFIWVGDTGGALDRDWITVNQIDPNDLTNFVIYRYVFPDAAEEVEAFLIPREGEKKPLFITMADGQANLFYPPGENQSQDTPMENVGTVTLAEGGSVTGAALNADGTKAALRTSNAVYEWTVADNDLIGALTGTEPVITPLADEGTAEGLTYGPDGAFHTLASGAGESGIGTITSYTPAAPAAEEPADGGADDGAAAEDEGPSLVDRILDLGFDTIVRILAAIAVLGMAVMIGGILVIRKYRKAQDEEDDSTEMGFAAEESVFGDERVFEDDPVDLGIEAGHPDPDLGQVARGAVYGAPRPEPSGNVYGAAKPEPGVYGGPARPEPSGNVYGAAAPARPEPGPATPPATGSVYGAPREEPQYGAFEGGGNGSVYDNAGPGQSFGPPRPVPPPPPPPPSPNSEHLPSGSVYRARPVTPPEPTGGNVYGGGAAKGSVYGAGNGERTPEPDDDGFWGPPESGPARGRGR